MWVFWGVVSPDWEISSPEILKSATMWVFWVLCPFTYLGIIYAHGSISATSVVLQVLLLTPA